MFLLHGIKSSTMTSHRQASGSDDEEEDEDEDDNASFASVDEGHVSGLRLYIANSTHT